MLLRKKAQSTAEYAILLALVAAVAGGILQVSLKAGMRQKNKEAGNYLLQAGSTELGAYEDQDVSLYSQEYRKTKVDASKFKNQSVMTKGGGTESLQKQGTETTSVSVETIGAE